MKAFVPNVNRIQVHGRSHCMLPVHHLVPPDGFSPFYLIYDNIELSVLLYA